MNRYQMVKQLGDGSFGTVWLATTTTSPSSNPDRVAVKKMKRKFLSWDECVQLREVKSLKRLQHRNIIKLREVVREQDELYFIFDYMEGNLYQLMLARKERCLRGFHELEIAQMGRQMLEGLSFMHQHGFFHRDMKPENVLVQRMPEDINNMGSGLELKLADFGLAREIRSLPPYTEYVSTRWYRAPEIILRSTTYSSPVDIWATGCILYELYALQPLFCGNTDMDQLFKITSLLGTPGQTASLANGGGGDWPDGEALAARKHIQFTYCMPTPLEQIMKEASVTLISLVRDMLRWDPAKRPTAQLALRYPLFSSSNSSRATGFLESLGSNFKSPVADVSGFSGKFNGSAGMPQKQPHFNSMLKDISLNTLDQNVDNVKPNQDFDLDALLSNQTAARKNTINLKPALPEIEHQPPLKVSFSLFKHAQEKSSFGKDSQRFSTINPSPSIPSTNTDSFYRPSLPRSDISIVPKSTIDNHNVDDLLNMDISSVPIFQLPGLSQPAGKQEATVVQSPANSGRNNMGNIQQNSMSGHKDSIGMMRSPLSWLSFHSRKSSSSSQPGSTEPASRSDKKRPTWLENQHSQVSPPASIPQKAASNRFSWLKPQQSGDFSASSSTASSGVYASAKQSLTGPYGLSHNNNSLLMNHSVIGSTINESNILFSAANAQEPDPYSKTISTQKESKVSKEDQDLKNLLSELSKSISPPPVHRENDRGLMNESPPNHVTPARPQSFIVDNPGKKDTGLGRSWLNNAFHRGNFGSSTEPHKTAGGDMHVFEPVDHKQSPGGNSSKSRKTKIGLPSWLQVGNRKSSSSSNFLKKSETHEHQSPPLQLK